MTIVYGVKGGLYVNITNRCPCACEFCIRRNGDGAYGSNSLWLEREPTVDEVVQAIDAADPSRYSEVVFCGYGEPTERLEDLLQIARQVKRMHPSIPIRVNTNGLADLIAGRPTAALFAGAVDALSISLNAATAEEYEGLCHPRFGRRSYEAMLDFAAQAKEHVPSVTLTVVRTPDLSEEKESACRRICEGIGVPLRVRTFVQS